MEVTTQKRKKTPFDSRRTEKKTEQKLKYQYGNATGCEQLQALVTFFFFNF